MEGSNKYLFFAIFKKIGVDIRITKSDQYPLYMNNMFMTERFWKEDILQTT